MKKGGRPMRYAAFIEALEDDQVYTPGTIVKNGLEKNLFTPEGGIYDTKLEGKELRDAKLRVRLTLARLSANHDFPAMGDGPVMVDGQPIIPGWTGKRWKSALK